MHSIFHSEYHDSEIVKFHMKSVIKLQAFFKGTVIKRRYNKTLKGIHRAHQYFCKNELFAFLTKCRFKKLRVKVNEKTYKKGGFYTGDMAGGFRDGKGKMTWKDGSTYEGNWSFGIPAGQGKFTYTDGDAYQGHWGFFFDSCEDHEISGLGLILWKENLQNGFKWLWCKSKIALSSPRSLIMTPRNEEKILEVQSKYLELTRIFELKSRTEIFLKINEKKYFIDDAVYEGDLLDGLRHGVGRMTWKDGEEYFGEWKLDQQSGWGKQSWPDNSKYVGFFFENQKEGIGSYDWPDSNSYQGEWRKNKMEGVGKYTWSNGKSYIGEWQESTLEGFGILFQNNEKKFEGFWHNGKKHGEGVTQYKNGKQSRDLWRNGKIIKPDI